MPHQAAVEVLEKWIGWARAARVPAFVKLQKSIVNHRPRILATVS